MADMPHPGAPPRAASRYTDRPAAEASGWVTFAGALLAILGTLNIVYGIAAISDSRVYVGDVEYVFGTLNSWGWFLCIAGAIQLLTAFGVWSGNELARWVGVFIAGLNAIIQLFFIPALPFLALALFAIDILVIYGLIAYGGRQAAT